MTICKYQRNAEKRLSKLDVCGIGCAPLIRLPVDAVVASKFEANAPNHAYGLDAVPADGMILDVGPQSIERVRAAIDDAATLVWNGPLGAFELTPFDKGTVEAAKHAAARTRAGKLLSVAGGGDTVAALNHAGVADDFSYVSTAGGAFLEWLVPREPVYGYRFEGDWLDIGDHEQLLEADNRLRARRGLPERAVYSIDTN